MCENQGEKEAMTMYPNQPMYGVPGFGFRNPMYQQAPMAPQPMQQSAPQQMTVTPVTGMAQVDSAQVSFDGAPLFFYDTSADAIYIKQFDSRNGTAPISVYRREAQAQPKQYATVDMLNELARKVEGLYAADDEHVRQRRAARREVDAD